MSHDTVNELLTTMGHTVLRSILSKIKEQNPAWYAIIGDEATDVNNREQLNVLIRYVNDDYVINDDSITLTELSDTFSETIYCLIKATLEVKRMMEQQ